MGQDRLRTVRAGRYALVLVAALGCARSGKFRGEVVSADADTTPPTSTGEHVEFSWFNNLGGDTGQMYARAADGRTYHGSFQQITRYTRASALDGFYGGWYGGGWYGSWGGWPYYGSVDQFITYYTNQVVALMQDDDGEAQMRCRFELVDPLAGMRDGGTGECQTSAGTRISAWFGPVDDD